MVNIRDEAEGEAWGKVLLTAEIVAQAERIAEYLKREHEKAEDVFYQLQKRNLSGEILTAPKQNKKEKQYNMEFIKSQRHRSNNPRPEGKQPSVDGALKTQDKI